MNYYNFEEDESIYLLDLGDVSRPKYVVATSEKTAANIARRLFDRKKYDFDWTEHIEIEDTGSQDIEGKARGSQPPFIVIVPHRYYMMQYEKRVNQGGFKGIYERRLNY